MISKRLHRTLNGSSLIKFLEPLLLKLRSLPVNQKDVHRGLLKEYFEKNKQHLSRNYWEKHSLERCVVFSCIQLRHETVNSFLQLEKDKPIACDGEEEPEEYSAVYVQRSDKDFDNHVLESSLVLSLQHWTVSQHTWDDQNNHSHYYHERNKGGCCSLPEPISIHEVITLERHLS